LLACKGIFEYPGGDILPKSRDSITPTRRYISEYRLPPLYCPFVPSPHSPSIVFLQFCVIIVNAAFVVRIDVSTSVARCVIVADSWPLLYASAPLCAFAVTVAAIFVNFGSADGFGILLLLRHAVRRLRIIFSFVVRFLGSLVNLNDAGVTGPDIDCPHLMNITS